MLPVLVFRFSQIEGPGYLGDFLTREGIFWTQINVDANDAVPDSISGYSGLVLMGGPMSVNDNLPWIAQVIDLIRQAIDKNIPVLGHCLGGQLMSKAMGAQITQNPLKEIGWGKAAKVGINPAPGWLGKLPPAFEVFQWHGETFSIPDGAVRVLESAFCPNQAWLMNDRHLALQCHIEMTAPMIVAWSEAGADEIRQASASPAVQQPAEMQTMMAEKLENLHTVADALYHGWIKGLRQ